jgi:hypothetical protein
MPGSGTNLILPEAANSASGAFRDVFAIAPWRHISRLADAGSPAAGRARLAPDRPSRTVSFVPVSEVCGIWPYLRRPSERRVKLLLRTSAATASKGHSCRHWARSFCLPDARTGCGQLLGCLSGRTIRLLTVSARRDEELGHRLLRTVQELRHGALRCQRPTVRGLDGAGGVPA